MSVEIVKLSDVFVSPERGAEAFGELVEDDTAVPNNNVDDMPNNVFEDAA